MMLKDSLSWGPLAQPQPVMPDFLSEPLPTREPQMMSELTPDEIAQALTALTPFTIKYRAPEDRIGSTKGWFVQQDVGVRDGHTEAGKYGNGDTPIEALLDHWRILTSIKEDEYLFVREGEIKVRWNGFMWKPA
jgi:hypothetical protein